MKHSIKIATISMAAALSFGTAHASVQNQSDIIKSKLKVGDYQPVAGHSSIVKITSIEPEKNQPHEHVIVSVGTTKYFPDNIAFPVTYYRAFYEGNAKLQKKVGYSVTRGPHVGKDRFVVVNDYAFLIDDWQNKDDYTVSKVFKVGGSGKPTNNNGIGGLFGAMVTVASGGTLGEDKNALQKDVLQPYLDQATAKQKSYYSTWIKNPTNAKTKQYLDDLDTAMTQAMRNYNKKIYNSPAHQRMLAHRRWMAKNIDVEVKNNTGSTVWVGSQDSPYYSGIPSGSSSTRTCTGDLYVHFSQDSKSGTKFYNARSACGSSVNIR